jgi:heat shock protein HtpX
VHSETWQSHALTNRMQSLLLLAVMGGLVAAVGGLLWGAPGVVVLLMTAAIGLLFISRNAGTMVLRMYGARRLRREQAPALYAAVDELARRAGLRNVPALAYVPSALVNGFATGTGGRAVIVVTDGLVRALDLRELVAVLAHEVSHIKSNDLWVMALADLMSRFTSTMSLFGQLALLISFPLLLMGAVEVNWLLFALLILAPTLSALAQLGLSRTREFHADLNAARLTGDPEGLAHALLKLERAQSPWWEQVLMPGRRVPEPSYLRTHPTTEERVERLSQLAGRPLRERVTLPHRTIVLRPEAFARHIGQPRWRVPGLWY